MPEGDSLHRAAARLQALVGQRIEAESPHPRGLGQDVLAAEFDVAAAIARLRGAGDLFLGEALQNQRLVAGIGNMWMAEALWEVRVSPWVRLRDASDATLRDALEAARQLMLESVATGRPGRRVYRRAGRPCPRCGTIVRSRGQGDANRTAYWCPGCQAGAEPPGE